MRFCRGFGNVLCISSVTQMNLEVHVAHGEATTCAWRGSAAETWSMEVAAAQAEQVLAEKGHCPP